MVEKYSKFVFESSVTWPFKGCSMCKNSVDIFPLVLSQYISIEEGCLLSILDFFVQIPLITIPEVFLCPLNVPMVNKHCLSQSNKEILFGNVTLNKGSHSCNSSPE